MLRDGREAVGEASPSPVYGAALLMRFGSQAHREFKSPRLRPDFRRTIPRVELSLADGLTTRPPRRDDLPALHRLIAAYEQRLLGEPLVDLEDLEADWQRPSFDPARDALLVLDGDALVGAADAHTPSRSDVVVHPGAWGRGIGSALLDWTLRTASKRGAARVGQTVPDADTAAAAPLRSRGGEPLWTSWVLELPPGEQVPPRPLPPGYRLRPYLPERDERAAYDVVEQAFAQWPDREPTSFEDWRATVTQRPGFAPWQLLLVEGADGQRVGVCHVLLSDGTGWVNQLAVDRDHRGRGIAQALLAEAYTAARERGARRSELSTDSRTGALDLYEGLGMRVRWSFTHWTAAG